MARNIDIIYLFELSNCLEQDENILHNFKLNKNLKNKQY